VIATNTILKDIVYIRNLGRKLFNVALYTDFGVEDFKSASDGRVVRGRGLVV
jgi:hypothetical protein